jgi:hypothetical protein
MVMMAGLVGCDVVGDVTGIEGGESSARWPNDVFTVDIGGVYAHDLAEGEVVDLAWASQSEVNCWPGNENTNFNGNHVFFATVQPANSFLTVAVTPQPGVDVSMYLMQLSSDEAPVPPNVDRALSCDYGADVQYDSNPGEVEYFSTLGYGTDVNVLIGVAGANGTTAGTFEVELFTE